MDNAITARMIADWRQQVAQVRTFEVPGSLDLEHSHLDPNVLDQPIDVVQVVYPILIEQFTQASREPSAALSK